MLSKMLGGLFGLSFPFTLTTSKLTGKWFAQTTVSSLSGMLSLGIAFIHLCLSSGCFGSLYAVTCKDNNNSL